MIRAATQATAFSISLKVEVHFKQVVIIVLCCFVLSRVVLRCVSAV